MVHYILSSFFSFVFLVARLLLLFFNSLFVSVPLVVVWVLFPDPLKQYLSGKNEKCK